MKVSRSTGTSNPAGAATITTTTPAEFKRFEDLTSKLVHVPKEELDEKREAAR